MVADSDIDGLVLQAAPPAVIKGRVTIDADVRPPFAPNAISILARGELEPIAGATSVKPDWTFTLDGLAANSIRIVGGSPFPDGWSIRSIRVGDVDMERTPLELSSGRTVNADVVITNRITALRGRITTDDTQRVPDSTVLVFSTDARRWLPGARGIVALRADQTGGYKCSGLPAGSYYAIALEFVDDGEESNPELLNWARARATRVELVEGETVTLDLALVRYEEVQ